MEVGGSYGPPTQVLVTGTFDQTDLISILKKMLGEFFYAPNKYGQKDFKETSFSLFYFSQFSEYKYI
jgi:hypothetical protein